MAPVIDIIRHAEAEHNIYGSHVRDAPLTPSGRAQCQYLARSFPHAQRTTHVVASPLRRTIETALGAFGPVLAARSGRIILLPELQEVNASPSSTGSPADTLLRTYGGHVLDTAHLAGQDWYLKGLDTPFAPEPQKVEARARKARVWLRELARTAAAAATTTTGNSNGGGGGGDDDDDEPHIVVVTHGEFAHWLTGDFAGVDHVYNTGWWNAEYRSFQFADPLPGGDDAEAALVETARSRELRRAARMLLSQDERQHARSKALAVRRAQLYVSELGEDEWEDEGEGEDAGEEQG